MNLIVNSQLLAAELRLLTKIVPTKPALQVLGCVALEAREDLHIFGTNLEIGLLTHCDAKIDAPGRTIVPFAKLLQMIEQFPDADVILTAAKSTLAVQCGSFASSLQTMHDDFPPVPSVDQGQTVLFDPEAFARLIAHSRYAISDIGSKYILKGALLTVVPPAAAMVATDAKRLSLATIGCDGPNIRTIVPAKTLDAIVGLSNGSNLELTVGNNHLFFRSGERLVVSRAIDGEFPKYEKFIPRDNDKVATVDRAKLAAALRRVGVVSDENKTIVVELLTEGAPMITLSSSSSGIGNAAESVSAEYTGPPMKVAIPGNHILDFLDAASWPTVKIALKDEKSPMLLTDGNDHISVVMLMR